MPAKNGKVVGLDFGRHSVKAVWAERQGGATRILRTEVLRLPQDVGDSRAVIQPWIEQNQLNKIPCVIGISGEQCMFQPLLLAPADPRDIGQAASMEVLQFNELASETMEYSFAPIPLNPVEKRLILAMARPSLIERVLSFARELGLNAVDVIPAPVALFNAMAYGRKLSAEPGLFVHIGRLTTDVAAGAEGSFMFGRAFSSGGQLFTDALAKARGLNASQAELQKLELGRVAEGLEPAQGGLTRPADLWLAEVQSCIAVYKSLYPERRSLLRRITLSGGGAALQGLPEHMTARLGLETVRCNALPGDAKSDAPAVFLLAAGLAISAFEDAPSTISLLPARLKSELGFRRQKPYWIAAAVTAGLILAVSLVGGYRDQKRKEAHLSAQRASLQKRQALVKEIEAIRAKNAQMLELAQPVGELLHAAPLMRDLTTLLATCMNHEDWLTMICDAESYFAPAQFTDMASGKAAGSRRNVRATPLPVSRESVDSRFHRIIIEGYTRTPNLSTVKKMISQLTTSEFVAAADLLPDDAVVTLNVSTNAPRDPKARRFVIDLRLNLREGA